MNQKMIMVLALALFFLSALAPGAALAIDVQKVVAKDGLEAWLVEDHTNPIIAMRFAFRGGAAMDPKGKEGMADMASSILDEGAGDLKSQAFQRRLEDLSIKLSFSAGRDVFGGSMRTLTKNSRQAFALLRLALNAPRFDKEPVERMRSQILASLRRNLEDPGTLAGRKLSVALFPGHPYGRPADGDLQSIAAITIADLKRFVKERLARRDLKIGVVGDITAKQLSQTLTLIFGDLPAEASPWNIPEVKPKADGRVIVINTPAPQSSIVFAQEGLKRADPDFYAAFVINHILGGSGFTARLVDEVREKRGLVYSIYSRLYPLDSAALLIGSAGTANANVGETIGLLRAEWRKMGELGVTQKELDDAKTYLTGSFPLRFSSSGRIASILVGMQLENLGIDYLEKRNTYIEAVTLAEANRVAKGLLNADALTIVVAGEPEGLESK